MPSFIKTLFISAVAVSAAAIERRDPSIVVSDIKAINGNITAVTEAANSYDGGMISAFPIQTAEIGLENSIQTANKAASNSKQLDSATTKQLLDFINNTLEPNIGKVLAALSNKKQQFTAGHISGVVGSDVKNLHQITDSLGDVLVNHVASADQKQAAQKALDQIDADFKKAESTWSETVCSDPPPQAAASAS